MRKGFLIVVAALFIAADVSADQVAALLRVKRSEQPDSLGFNLVEQITKITYHLKKFKLQLHRYRKLNKHHQLHLKMRMLFMYMKVGLKLNVKFKLKQ